MNVILNEINGKTHDGKSSAPVPALFGMNFQAVSVGQKLVENGIAGGYTDALGTPSANLLQEIQFVDSSIGKMVNDLKEKSVFDSTLIIITAKHGQSPIDPHRVLRIPAEDTSLQSPAKLLGSDLAAQASEDDVSLIWLKDQSQTGQAVSTLENHEQEIGAGEIFSGPSLNLLFNDPMLDPRTPDIIVTPNVGVTYTGGRKKVAEHGGFAHDDTNVMMLLSNPSLFPRIVTVPVTTTQVAPTILKALGINPTELQAVRRKAPVPCRAYRLRGRITSETPREAESDATSVATSRDTTWSLRLAEKRGLIRRTSAHAKASNHLGERTQWDSLVTELATDASIGGTFVPGTALTWTG